MLNRIVIPVAAAVLLGAPLVVELVTSVVPARNGTETAAPAPVKVTSSTNIAPKPATSPLAGAGQPYDGQTDIKPSLDTTGLSPTPPGEAPAVQKTDFGESHVPTERKPAIPPPPPNLPGPPPPPPGYTNPN